MLLPTGKDEMLKQLARLLIKYRAKILSFVYGIALPVRRQRSWLLRGRPTMIRRRGSTITIGDRFTACSDPRFNSLGVFQKVYIRTCTPEAIITIGDNVGMSGCTISSHKKVAVGNNVLIGSGALITDSDAHSLDWVERRVGKCGSSAPVVIEDDVFVGARSIILKGVTIGRGAVIGAGAVVAMDVPPMSVVVGNPARVIRRLYKEGKE